MKKNVKKLNQESLVVITAKAVVHAIEYVITVNRQHEGNIITEAKEFAKFLDDQISFSELARALECTEDFLSDFFHNPKYRAKQCDGMEVSPNDIIRIYEGDERVI